MADGRMLHKKISLNEAVASLENDTHRLLFAWGLAHLDIEGRISGSPKVFRAIVVPLLEHITSEKVAKFFKDAESQGLILRYQVGKDWFIEYPKFTVNQRLRADREAPSKLPPPPDLPLITPGESPEDSSTTPGELPEDSALKFKLSLREDKNPPSPLTGGAPPFQKIIDLWNTHAPELLPRASLTDKRKPKIKAAWKEYPDLEWWKALFADISLSPWHSHQDKWQGCSFDWILAKRTEMREKLNALKGNGSGKPAPQSRDPACPRCRGSGLYRSGEAPDGKPMMAKCECKREGHDPTQPTAPAATGHSLHPASPPGS